MSSRLLFVHPHPDDESIACGGVLARYRELGVETHVVTCTGGEAGENLAGIDVGDRDFAEVRRSEMEAAVEVLGLTSHRFLGYRDSGMAGTPENEHPDAFVQADLEEAAERLAEILRQLRPHVVVSDNEQGTYGHPDHIRAHAVTRRAVQIAADEEADVDGEPWTVGRHVAASYSRSRLLAMHRNLLGAGLASPFGEDAEVTADQLDFGVDDDLIAFRIDVMPWFDIKLDAMASHASQIAPDSFFLNTPAEQAPAGFGTEEFELISGTPPPNRPAEDLLDGLGDLPA